MKIFHFISQTFEVGLLLLYPYEDVLEDISGVKFESVWVPMAVVLMFNVSDVGLNAVSTDADIRLILAFISLSEMIFKMLKY